MVQLLSVKGEKLVIWIPVRITVSTHSAALRLVPAVLFFLLTGKHWNYSITMEEGQVGNHNILCIFI